MAKLGSSSSSCCRPLLQGMMLLLLALLLLASIQAGPVMASVEQFVADLGEKAPDLVKKTVDKGANKFFTELGKIKGWKDFSNGGKKWLKVHKYLCKAQGLMDKQNPAGGTPAYSVDIVDTRNVLGDLSRSFPSFSYHVMSEGRVCGYRSSYSQPAAAAAGTPPPPATLVTSNDGGVRVTGIRVGQEVFPVQTPAELNRPPLLPAYPESRP